MAKSTGRGLTFLRFRHARPKSALSRSHLSVDQSLKQSIRGSGRVLFGVYLYLCRHRVGFLQQKFNYF